jgi:AraC-like DNA-binding protein
MPKTSGFSRARWPARLAPTVDRARMRENFLKQFGSIESFQNLTDHLPGLYFYIKDNESRLMWGNQALLTQLKVANLDELTGTTDRDYFPIHIADTMRHDDQYVFNTGKPILGRVGVWFNQQHVLDWFLKNKFALYDRSGKIVGLIGTNQSYAGMRDANTPFADISKAIEHIRSHFREDISIADLAKICGVSQRQLHRRFQRALGLSVQQFLMKTRIQSAADSLIRSNQSISDVALEHGFFDQSAFTRQFRENTGLTPRKFRQRHSILPASG